MEDKISIVLDNIFNRRSVRHFTGKVITREQFLTLLKAGMAAPTAKNLQPWAFITVTEPELLKLLSSELPFAKMLPDAGAAIIVCGDLIKASEASHPDLWAQDCAAATENILLAAEAMGLGAVWTATWPHRSRSGFVARIMELPEHIVPFNVIAIGHPTGEDLPKNKFREENIHWGKW